MRTNGKRLVSVSMVLMMVLLGLVVLAPSVSAGIIGDVPVRPFKIEAVSWDADKQEFVVEMSVRSGIAFGGSKAGFTVSTGLEIDTGDQVFTIDPKDGGVSSVDPKDNPVSQVDPKDTGMYIPIEPQRIPWDRDDGTYEGTATVTATTELLNPGGRSVSSTDPEDNPVKITAKGEEPPAPDPDGDGKE